MASFAPAYRLINGHAYAGDGSLSTAPIVAAPGDGVLLRYVNAGVPTTRCRCSACARPS